MKRILLLVILLILYGSFYPWQFHARTLAANPLWILLHSWPAGFDRFDARDMAINIALYIPFGTFCFLSIRESQSRLVRSLWTLLAAALLSATVEMVQLFDVSRVCSLFDVLCNSVGASIGILIAATFSAAIAEVVQEAEGALRLSGTMALLYLWAGYQIFPAIPALSRTVLHFKLSALLSSGTWSTRGFLESGAAWLAAAALIDFLTGPRFRYAMPVALLAIPLKLFIAQRNVTGSELAGALLGLTCWLILRKLHKSRWKAGIIVLAAIVAAGLVPFHWSATPQHFTWIPFLSMLQSPWESAFLILLQKSFLYGAAVWLLTESGRGWLVPTLMVAAPLAIVEGLQVHLPGRTAEVTDPLLALLMGLSLMLLEGHARRAGCHQA